MYSFIEAANQFRRQKTALQEQLNNVRFSNLKWKILLMISCDSQTSVFIKTTLDESSIAEELYGCNNALRHIGKPKTMKLHVEDCLQIFKMNPIT